MIEGQEGRTVRHIASTSKLDWERGKNKGKLLQTSSEGQMGEAKDQKFPYFPKTVL